MVSKKRKELRRRTKQEVDQASSGEGFLDSVKKTLVAEMKGLKEEKKLDMQENVISFGSALAGAGLGALSVSKGEISDDYEASENATNGYTISDDELLKKLLDAETDAGYNSNPMSDKVMGDMDYDY